MEDEVYTQIDGFTEDENGDLTAVDFSGDEE